MDVNQALDEYYEEKFEFPLWKMIKEHAEKRDISYSRAAEEVVPIYVKSIPEYRQDERDDAMIKARLDEMKELQKREAEELAEYKSKGG